MASSFSHGDTVPLPNDSQEDSIRMFHERGLLLFFTARIPLALDVAHAINASVEREVDKVFYSRHGLFEVILKDRDIKLQFLEQQTIFLCGLMAHVFPWKPIKAMKEELLFKCPVWVELIDLPSFLWSSIGQVAKVLGKLLYTPSISAPNKNRICVMWSTSRPFPKTLGINIPKVGRIVIYLKWGNMARSCFHCGNLSHYSKNCPTLKNEGVNLIPACPGSKILVPEEQVFGRPRNMPNMMNTCSNDALRSTPFYGIGNKRKEIAVEKHVLPATSIAPAKLKIFGSSFSSFGLLSYCSVNIMKLATWNIQGLGQYGKWTRLWRLIIRHQLDMVAIQEHKKNDHAGMLMHTRDFSLRYNGLKNGYSGRLFIIKKDIPFQVLFDDPQGRFLVIHLLMHDIPYICINVYAPNSPLERVRTWENILQAVHYCEQLLLWNNARIILCGDFNMVERDTDCTTAPSLISSQEKWLWSEILDSLNCKDLWGCIGGHTLRYTFHSRSHRKAMSRLDRCYYSHASTLSPVSNMWIDATILLSDHSPVLLLLCDSNWTECIPDKLHRIPLGLNHAWIRTTVFKAKVEDLIMQVLASKLSASLKWEALVVDIFSKIMDNAKVYYKGRWKLNVWNKFFSHALLQTSSPTFSMLVRSFKQAASLLKWNGRQRYLGNSFASLSPFWSFLANPPLAHSMGAGARYFNNKGIDSIAKCYDSKWEFLSFPSVRRIYVVGPAYRAKWFHLVLFLQKFQIPLSIDASQPWCDWLFAKHTRWWNGAARTFYFSLLDGKDITFQCNVRWKLDKTRAWWHTRFSTIWDSYLTFRMKVFMWRILVGHFTLGAFLSKHGLQGVRCPHCASYAQTMRHAFWTCSYIQRWWNSLFLFPIWDSRPSKFYNTFLLFESTNAACDWVRKRCVFFLLSNIWKLKNKRLFGNKSSVPHFSWTLCKAKLKLDMEVM
ncbi:hypothetical protein KP509_07G050500 [Ceratopteris richardii]|uniref:CCHC-type domain-containing protein n=1 Tax=Ceratopteris richardii TaxID=49495 RepID=A0A8T2UHQ0_CERRI|nr:hypothetical protein KP509_07G050500 [Ceratopteris richardii]